MLKPSILIVDDEAGVRSALSGVLRDEGYDVEAVDSGEACLDRAIRAPFDAIVLDIWLPGLDGLATLAKLQERRVDAPVIMISGHGNIESAVRAIKTGAFDFIEKPLSLEKTVLVVGNAVRQRRLEVENRELRATVDKRHEMVGESYVLRQLLEQVAMAAPTNGRVLIHGENGTGKELVARAIHMRSRRARGPFIEVNCAAIPEELIESELFGHMKGAFTGAVLDRAATNKDLPTEIRLGRFREDLYFRLNVIPIFVPPLRDRGHDIELLADHFMAEFAREYGRRPKRLDAGAATGLRSYRWPGNVRELRNVIERLMIMVPGDTIALTDLAFLDGGALRSIEDQGAPELSLHDARERFERDYILRALAAQHGNISRTADALGVERSNLYRKMKAFGIAPARREEEAV